jgi:nucleoside-diphosphate-sugar epimerase
MRIIITGITGFVGGHLVEFALARGLEVVGSYRWRSNTANTQHIRHRVEIAVELVGNSGHPPESELRPRAQDAVSREPAG